jgi:hypothetical protein
MQGQGVGQAGVDNSAGLVQVMVDESGPANSGVGGWETFGPVTPGNGPLAAGSPSVFVQVLTDDFDCKTLGLTILENGAVQPMTCP